MEIERPRIRVYNQYGTRNPNSKLDEEKVRQIRKAHAEGNFNAVSLAKEFGVSRGHIWNIVARRIWNNLN